MLSENELYTHNLFPYPAKFPALPIKNYIQNYSCPGDTVLDPFCGSGTVLVEALLHNRNAIGIDLSPVATLISKAKTNLYTSNELAIIANIASELKLIDINKWISDSINESDIPQFKNISLWFKPNMLRELTALKKVYLKNKNNSGNCNELLWMAFLKIIVSVSNRDTDTRYTAIEKKEHIDGYAVKLFRETLEDFGSVITRNLRLVQDSHSIISVVEGDVNKSILDLEDSSVDMAITSPPYINTFDYYLYHKQRIFWMDENPQAIRRQEIGCHHRVDGMTYDQALNEYSGNMDSLLKNIYIKLKPNKVFIMLVGDGIVKGKMVYADELISELAIKNGFSIVSIDSISLKEVSKGFIKGKNLDKKKHHVIIMQR